MRRIVAVYSPDVYSDEYEGRRLLAYATLSVGLADAGGATMSMERNKAIVRESAERLFNQGDLSAADALITADAIDHCEPAGTDCRQHFRQVVTMLRSAFPDLHIEIGDMVAEGDSVAVRMTMTGTHKGPFMGMPPTGKQFAVEQMRFMRFRDGMMTDSWAVIDWLGWRQQLGAQPQPQRATA
jgi:steroid delta-isomerase-like uncharacterized protein